MSSEAIKNVKRSVEFMGYTAVYGKPDKANKVASLWGITF